MAFDKTHIDTNRETTGLEFTPEQSSEIFAKAIESSAIMQLAQKVELPGSGISIQVITGDPVAAWTGETEEAAVSKSGFKTKTMTPYKMTVTELFSNEFKRDKEALYKALAARLPKAIGTQIDATVLGGEAPGTGFDVLSAATAVDIQKDVYKGFVTADTTVAANDGELNGYVLSPQAKALLLNAVDTQGRPLFVPNMLNDNVPGSVLGAPVHYKKAAYKAGVPNVLGVAGDWATARYGTVEGIKLSIATEATVNDGTHQINLWQRGMFAIMAEIEFGFVCEDTKKFVRLTETGA